MKQNRFMLYLIFIRIIRILRIQVAFINYKVKNSYKVIYVSKY